MAIEMGTAPYLLYRGLQELRMDQQKLYSSDIVPIAFKIQNTERSYEEYATMVSIGMPQLIPERGAPSVSDIQDGYMKRITPQMYGMMVRIGYMIWINDLYGMLKELPGQMAKRMTLHTDLSCLHILNAGHTSAVLCIDGKPLFALDHPIKSTGGTYANRNVTPATVTVSMIQNAIDSVENQLSDENFKLNKTVRHILCNSAMRWRLNRLLASDKEPFLIENTINALNYLFGDKIKTHVDRYLTSDVDLILLDDKSETDFVLLIREDDKDYTDVDFFSRDMMWQVIKYFETGVLDWKGTYKLLGA